MMATRRAPSGLSPQEGRFWRFYAPQLAALGRLTQAARDVLVKYCTALAIVEDLRAQLATPPADGVLLDHRPAVRKELRQWLLVCRLLENDLLINPASAMRASATTTSDREEDGFEEFDHPPALQPVVTFAYITGWRIQSEILPMEWRHVDQKAGEARLEPGTTKNQAGRVFPFTDALRVLVADLWAEHKALEKAGTICRYVFHRKGRRIKGLRTAWANACTAAGCPGRIPHDLRRSAVRNMERAGLSRSVAMQLTGHKTEAVYRRYAITSEADLREGVERLNGPAQSTSRERGRTAV